MTCGKLFQVPVLQNDLHWMAATEQTERPIRWTHIIDNIAAVDFLEGDELVLFPENGAAVNEQLLLQLVDKLSDRHTAGLVLNMGKFIRQVPDSVVKRAEQLHFPLFWLPWRVKLVDVSLQIGERIVQSKMEKASGSHLLYKILFADEGNYEDFVRSAQFYGFRFTGKQRIVKLYFSNFKQLLVAQAQNGSYEKLTYRIQGVLEEVLKDYHKTGLFLWKGAHLIVMEPVFPQKDLSHVIEIAEYSIKQLEERVDGLQTAVGIGEKYAELSDLKKSYAEAQFALKMVLQRGEKGVQRYRTAGVYKFFNKLNNQELMKQFYEETLGKLINYDSENQMDLVRTLKIYLEEGENAVQTARRLFIHRNTLKYRLQRIEEILEYNPSENMEKINIQIAFQIKKYLDLVSMHNEDEFDL